MPKYRVFIHETYAFIVDVQADDEAQAGDEAMRIFDDTTRSFSDHQSEIAEVYELEADAEVENEDECDECANVHSGIAGPETVSAA